MTRIVILLAAAALLAGCGSALTRADDEQTYSGYRHYAGEAVDGFTAFRMLSWQPVARNKLVIWTGVNEAWLLTVWDNCPDLHFVHTIRVTSTGSRVTTFDKVIAGRDRCPIRGIQPVDVRQMKADRKAEAALRQ